MTTVRRRIKWAVIPGTDGRYEVSTDGGVRSTPRAGATRGRMLMLTPATSTGYVMVTISSAARGQFTTSVHTSVLRAFCGPPKQGQQARHLNGDQLDNRLQNLAWGTASENNLDRVRHGTHQQAAKTHCIAGHPFDDENTGVDQRAGGVSRRCRTCDRERKATLVRQVKTSQQQEARGAKLHGGRVRPGSGSMPAAKGDVRVSRPDGPPRATSGTLIEYKRTENKGIRLTTVMLEKIRTEALLEGRQHLLGFELGGRDYVVVPAERYAELDELERRADAADWPDG